MCQIARGRKTRVLSSIDVEVVEVVEVEAASKAGTLIIIGRWGSAASG
jgi:hypothetical protein